MILIPEIETVVILVPRTGSGSLRKAVKAKYPKSMELYRHMEADGIPQAYDRWRKVGVVRDPIARMWSLFKFLRDFGEKPEHGRHDAEYVRAMRASVDRPFSEWLTDNEATFTDPYSRRDGLKIHPFYSCRHPMPENRKSQFVYLRPDLGTEVFQHFMGGLDKEIGLTQDEMMAFSENVSSNDGPPVLSFAAACHVRNFFSWDLAEVGRHRITYTASERGTLVRSALRRMTVVGDSAL